MKKPKLKMIIGKDGDSTRVFINKVEIPLDQAELTTSLDGDTCITCTFMLDNFDYTITDDKFESEEV